ncbi:mannitol-1-phosphate 5-dehydrogenase [Flagelloscypha sp. PMI_526]|nr:mannitol-1-phosphate 5-dehydrogenase [Flagelloscypha sp. PMI_526]
MPDSGPSSSPPNLGKRALHFGAGNIGRGFIGPLLSESGYTVTFADIDEHTIDLLNTAHHYSLEIVSEKHTTEIVRHVEGVISTSPEVVEFIGRVGVGSLDLITTSVGPAVLPRLAGSIAAGLEARMLADGAQLNVIACENLIGATDKLAEAVLSKLSAKARRWANCAVDRIVPSYETPEGASDLDVGVEPFFEWTVDESPLKGNLSIPGMHLVSNLPFYIERKLYTLNCGHASLAYLGFIRGHETIYDAMHDDELRTIVEHALRESGQALTKKYDEDPKEHVEYIKVILERFSNPVLKDSVRRIGRDPLRKLQPDDRLVGPTNMLREFGLPRDNLLICIAAALHFHVDEDEASVELQKMIHEKGVEGVLKEVVEWRTEDSQENSDIKAVLSHYEALKKWKKE